jgi:predicted  nucleic acid-binding Zn-ribbon protein
MEFICAKCNHVLEKTAHLLTTGCPFCGSKVFKTVKTGDKTIGTETRTEEEEQKEYRIVPKLLSPSTKTTARTRTDRKTPQEQENHDGIASINLKEKGVYEINLDSLFRDKKTDPIILSSKTGVYRVEILPVKKKRKKKKEE